MKRQRSDAGSVRALFARASGPQGSLSGDEAPSGSRYSECPACRSRVSWQALNWHLDIECPSLNRAQRARTNKPSPWTDRAERAASGALEPEDGRRGGGLDAAAFEQRDELIYGNEWEDAARDGAEIDGNEPPTCPAGIDMARRGTLLDYASPSQQALSRLRPPAPLTLLARRKLQTLALTPAELLAATACEVVPCFLPEALATKLLQALSRASGEWVRGRWYINGALRDGRMTSRAYFFAKSGGEGIGVEGDADWAASGGRAESGYEPDPAHCSRSVGEGLMNQIWGSESNQSSVATARALEKDRGLKKDSGLEKASGLEALMQGASDCICAFIHAQAPLRQSLLARRAGVDLSRWEPTLVLANRYADGRQAVGAHSDMLTTLGPAPLVASLSLGATRTFRLRRRVNMPCFFDGSHVQVGPRADLPGSCASIPLASRAPSAAVLPGWEVFDVLLPHNALLLMYPGVQEAFTHEVVPEASVRPHPLAGSTRFNLTFRAARPDWAADVPQCHCRRPACLKSRGPSLRQKKGQQPETGPEVPLELVWAYVCDYREGEPCGFYKVAFKVPIVAGQEKPACSS